MKYKLCLLLVILVFLNLIALVFKSVKNENISQPTVLTPLINLNSSSDNLSAINPDGTMGPSNWQGNYSNSLPDSVKGTLTFYVTDPPLIKKIPQPIFQNRRQK